MTTQEKGSGGQARRSQRYRRPQPKTRKFTVAEYYRMGEAGILGPDERVELIEGEIV